MKNRVFSVVFTLFLLSTSGFLLTGCGSKDPDTVSDAEVSENPDAGEQDADPDTDPDKAADTTFPFPDALPFIDDTGKSMQRDGNCFYSFHNGRLIRFDADTEETVLLYQTASIHRVTFCLHENDIYFVERTSIDSPDGKDTSLWRIGKDGQNLTLLAENIVNAEMFRDGSDYSIDIYDGIIYLLHIASVYENDIYVTKTANLYYRLQEDGSVREAAESETLYGMLPQHLSPVLLYDFPSLPYAMRNYGYVFVQDSGKILYRLEPESGREESLTFHTENVTFYGFSGAMIFLWSQPDNAYEIYNLIDKTSLPTDRSLWESLSCLSVFPWEDGFYVCGSLLENDQNSDGYRSRLMILKIFSDGSVTPFFSDDPLPFGEDFNEAAIRTNSCLLEDHLYYYDDDETLRHLMRIPLRKNPDLQILESWVPYPAVSPAVLTVEESNEETEIGDNASFSCSHKKIFLEEETEADGLINAALGELYADFEKEAQNMFEEAQGTVEEEAAFYEETFDYPAGFDLSLTVSCDYMDDDIISFCCSYYEYYAYAAHGYYWSNYHVFDRTSGKQLTSGDFVEDTVFFETALPYLQKVSNAEFNMEMLSDPTRFSLSEDGFTLYFAPYEIASYAEGAFLITIPYEAFEQDF